MNFEYAYTWPGESYMSTLSSNMIEVMKGKLLFAQWEQAHAAADMHRHDPGSDWWIFASKQQRRAYKQMVAARAGLDYCERYPEV
jgi:hypothetical protein